MRWGDEKPRRDGVYVPGTASGQLTVAGVPQGTWRNVAAVETQVWDNIKVPDSAAEQTISVAFQGDDARVHWLRVYYTE